MNPVLSAAKRAWRHRRFEIVDWAEKNVRLSNKITAQSGPFRRSNAPWEVKPLRAIADDDNEIVVLIKGNQVGGSTIGVVSMAFLGDQDPGPTMWTTGNQDLARDFSKDTLFPILRGITTLDESVLNDRGKASTYELRFPAWTLLLAWGGSESKAEQKAVRRLYLDEFGKYLDLVPHFEKRTTRFPDSRKVYISYPGLTEGAEWLLYQTTDQNEWFWSCLKKDCGAPLPMKWKGHVFWDKFLHASGQHDWAKIYKTLRYVCPHCGHEHFENYDLHTHIANNGDYTALQPKASEGLARKLVGFRFNGMLLHQIDGAPAWQRICKEFIEAAAAAEHGSMMLLQTVINKRIAESFDERDYEKKWVPDAVTYEPVNKWEKEFRRYMTVDRQAYDVRFYVVRAWSDDGESQLIAEGTVVGKEKLREVQLANSVADNYVCQDSGFDAIGVYKECAEYGWFAMKGEDRDAFTKLDDDQKKDLVSWLWSTIPEDKRKLCALVQSGSNFYRSLQTDKVFGVFLFSSSGAMDLLNSLMRSDQWRYHDGASAVYREHIGAARRVTRWDTKGKRVTEWHYKKGKDHLLACEKMQVVCATAGGQLKVTALKKEEQEVTATTV